MHPNKWGTNIKKDPMSHRIIEKRRRDRMNNCLADLSRLVPTNYLKKGRGRIEKTEIIEMAIKHLKHLQAHPCKDPANCEVAKTTEQDHKRQYRLGYHECMSETVRFMVESEGLFSGDSVCVRLINHLQKHYDKVAGGICYTQALGMMLNEDTKSTVQMEVDTQLSNSNNCFPTPDSNSGPPPLTDNGYPSPAPFQFEPQHPHSTPNGDSVMVPPPELKQEEVVVATPTPVKATSQLREMLQNPGLPPKTALAPPPVVAEPPKPEEGCYKFKNNIKHRFNNDLRHHTSSPTDHLMGEEDHNNNKILHPSSDPYGSLRHGGVGHAFSPYPSHHSHHEKGDQPWEASSSPAETTASSSCGSNPSPPPARSCCNGSSSGYSTAGETPNAPVGPLKASPASYSSSSRRTPSPVPGVPIFALHPKGTFYVPLTIEASLLVPYMSGLDDLAPVLHPISICVNLSSHSLKVEGPGHHYTRPHSSFLMDKFHDRYVYAEKPQYYPSSASPPRT